MSSLIAHNQQNSLVTQRDITLLSPIVATYGSVENFCRVYSLSKHCPPHLEKKPVEIQLMIAYGLCFGLHPFAAIKNVMVLNNIPSLYGDAVTAMCHATRQLRKLQVSIKHTDNVIENLKINDKPAKNIIATCNIIREGVEEITTSFSLIEANEAGLLFAKDKNGKPYPKVVWHKYTTRMLSWRAKTYAIREAFPDKLVGLTTFEELIDYPDVNYDGEIVFNENGSARLVPTGSKTNRNNQAITRSPIGRKNHQQQPIQSQEEYVDGEIMENEAQKQGIECDENIDMYDDNSLSDEQHVDASNELKQQYEEKQKVNAEREKFKKQMDNGLAQFINSSLEEIEVKTTSQKYQDWTLRLQESFPDLFAEYNERLTNIIDEKMKLYHKDKS